MGTRWLVAMAAALLAGTVLIGSAGAAPVEGAEVPASIAPARIYVSQRQYPAVGHTFSFYVYLDVCPTPLLELDHTTLVERRRTATHKGVAIVTAYLRWPAHVESEAPCPPEVPIKKVVHVKTKQPAAELVFFDGSSSPPRQIWPPVKPAPVRHRRTHSCGPAKDTTLLADSRARIYSPPESKPQFGEPIVYGCLVSTGHSIKLSPLPRTAGWRAGGMYGPFALTVPWAAGAVTLSRGRDAHGLSVAARNLQTGQIKSCLVGGGHGSPRSTGGVGSIALKRNGSLAWAGHARIGQSGEIERQFPPREIVACDSEGERLLDSGESIDLYSLKLHGSKLTWTDAGETRSATLE